MGVRQPAALGIQREVATGRGALPGDEGSPLALPAKAQVLQGKQHGIGEAVVDFGHVNVVVADAGHGQGAGAGYLPRPRCQIGHLADDRVVVVLAKPQHSDRRLQRISRPFLARQNHRAAGVGHQTAVQQVERPANPAARQHVGDGQRLAHQGLRVQRRPLARRYRDLGQLLVRRAVEVHVARAGHRVGAQWSRQPPRLLELRDILAVQVGRRTTLTGAPALAVADERHATESVGDGAHGMADVDDKR